jgi:PAS domain S-box-containing protein
MQHLLLLEDDRGKRPIALSDTTKSIGRDVSNSIVLQAQDVSRQHAILLRVPHSDEQDCLFRIVDGNWQGKPSTNGLFVNGKRCSSSVLRHGDTLQFGGTAQARYYTIEDSADIHALCLQIDGDSDMMATLIADLHDQACDDGNLDKLHDAALVRLASFPELFSHPIIEVSTDGTLTYLNPAAVKQFPEIQTDKLAHPLLENLLASVRVHQNQNFTREVTVESRIFEQSIHFIPESDLIRSYLVDITERKQAEALWQENARRFRAIFNQTTQFAGLLDPTGIVVEVNQTALDFAGLERADVLYAPLWLTPWWITLTEVQEHLRKIIQVAALGQFVRYETEVLNSERQVIPLDFSLKPIRDEENEIVLIIFEGHDLSDYRRAEAKLKAIHDNLERQVKTQTLQLTEATERLRKEEKALLLSYATNRALLNAIPDPMFRINRDGVFVNFKKPKQYTLPFDPEKYVQCPLSEVFSVDIVQKLKKAIIKTLETDETHIVEFQLMVGERLQDYEARLAVSAEDEVMMILRDITERKRSEADVRKALERERDLNELKTRFVSMTSHEFRTPLTTILSSAELLEHYHDRWDTQKQLKYLDKIQNAAMQMTELLNDVLLINKVEAGKVEFAPEPMEIASFCREIIDELQMASAGHTILFQEALLTQSIPVDHKLMRHILTNLLSNAINYSPQGGEIRVELKSCANEMVLIVRDSGIGIPESSLPTIFESFVRGHNVGTISGTGLGLAIVKRSVDLHQGEITCQSIEGEGTTFTVRLPIEVSRVPNGLGEVLLVA